ncbi:YggS family pyridoxal phosphate-dependent enzyme [Devosia sp. XJ19-1]|uniref:Pyridoxal phosphate homeostasis protein n=1 Tax=Devosia ureilytica TaxID=2952754 RepID=A0A9Q4FS22_9HYPH|nr:YggS family pyridoxal phosphate-dependent enzyme [Devosia ureilytica]MCP8882884.1 YggS family pyridoxal phosphate-dependent enzyme [Devosia ureilytica]MCP8886748.1 YggS family pyridoxal phosphate-dependent enzyme [Devosia ureilytica]
MVETLQGASAALDYIRTRMEKARRRFGAPPEAVELVAVSKTFAAEAVEPFLVAGQRVFGENRVQEAKDKWPALRERYPDIALHLIGPLQTNKAREAVALFDVIETLDRDKLAGVLAAEMARLDKRLPCFVQVNIGGEAQKAGIAIGEAVDFVRRCREEHGLEIVGLMCIPPDGQPAGPYFALLAELAEAAGVEKLSMGMSGDFETAIAMGATHVRVGSALFGRR